MAVKDARLVDRLIAALEGTGHEMWIDRADLRGGEQWRQQIVTAIDGSDFFLLVLSPHSVKSDNVRKELDLAPAGSVKKRVLPLVVKPVSLPGERHGRLLPLPERSAPAKLAIYWLLWRLHRGSPDRSECHLHR